MTSRRAFLALTVAIPVAGTMIRPALAAEPPVYQSGGVAINGYDAVAYFTEGRPVEGDAAFKSVYDGAEFRFSSAENKALFDADPEAFAPQYGGYCAFAVANGYTAKTDPDAWSIHEGKLYLNFNRSIRRRWSRDIPGNIQKGDANWPAVLQG
ncbi:MAG: YHS domain-containing (seleno)protein [Pseudomonadota bacterium]